MNLLENNFKFMDIDESQDEKFDKYVIENNIDLNKIKTDREQLQRMVIELKRDNDISLRKIAEKMEMSREKIRKLYVK